MRVLALLLALRVAYVMGYERGVWEGFRAMSRGIKEGLTRTR